jgi:hypothetical protein
MHNVHHMHGMTHVSGILALRSTQLKGADTWLKSKKQQLLRIM